MGLGYFRRPRLLGRRSPNRRAACALLTVLAIALLPVPAQARTKATALGVATVLDPLTVVNTDDMDFGRISALSGAGTVVLSPQSAAQCTTTGGLIHTGNCRAATFEGAVSFLFQLRVQRPNGNQITLNGPAGATMRVDNFTYGPGAGVIDLGQLGANHRFLILSLNGSYQFFVGGRLNVAANQQPGIYRGSFDVQLNYN